MKQNLPAGQLPLSPPESNIADGDLVQLSGAFGYNVRLLQGLRLWPFD